MKPIASVDHACIECGEVCSCDNAERCDTCIDCYYADDCPYCGEWEICICFDDFSDEQDLDEVFYG